MQSDQVHSLTPTDFKCYMSLKCSNDSAPPIQLNGTVAFMFESPLRLDFNLTPQTQASPNCAKETLVDKEDANLFIKCDVSIRAPVNNSFVDKMRPTMVAVFERSISLHTKHFENTLVKMISSLTKEIEKCRLDLQLRGNFFFYFCILMNICPRMTLFDITKVTLRIFCAEFSLEVI